MLAEMDTIYRMTRKVASVNCHLEGVASLQSVTKLIDTIRLKGPFKIKRLKCD